MVQTIRPFLWFHGPRPLLGMAGSPEPLATRSALLGMPGPIKARGSKDAPFKTVKPGRFQTFE